MGLIRIISDVDDEGMLHIHEKLTLRKGRVELIIKPIDEDNENIHSISFSNHFCGRIMNKSLNRDEIYGDDGR